MTSSNSAPVGREAQSALNSQLPRRGRLFTAHVVPAAVGGLIGALLFASPVPSAGAEPAAEGASSSVRYTRSSGKIKAKATLDTKFKAAQEDAERDRKRQVDMMSADQFARQREAVAQEIADEQIDRLVRLIKASEPTDAEYPDFLFRLCDHHLDKKAYFERQAGALFEKIYEAEEQGKTAEVAQYKQKQAAFEKKAQESSAEAVKVYQLLVTKPVFAKYKRLDEAIYFYAFELGQLKREAEMQDAYLRLIREYPTSKYIPNAYLSFADFKFANNEIQDALKLYQKIVDGYKDSPVYAYALYKMAWCYLNPIGTAEPQYRESLNKFVETISATLAGKAGNEANGKQLRRDARRDLVKAYVHAGKPSTAWAFFQKVGDGPKKDEDMARKMMELLAQAYFGDGMYVESSATYKKMQEEFSTDPDRCSWQSQIVINALATDDKQIQWQETDRLGEYWSEYKDGKFTKPIKKKCRDDARDTTREMATVWHDEAEKTRKLDAYDFAENAYRAYMKYFPEDKDAYEMNYYYAELLWAQGVNNYNQKDRATQEIGLKKFAEAHDEFLHTLERQPDGKYTQDAAFAQMLAMKNALEYDETGGKKRSCEVNSEGVCVYREAKTKKKSKTKDTKTDTAVEYPETPYTEDETRMLKAYDIYQKYVKDASDKELPKILYHRGKLMMEHNKFTDARPMLEDLVTRFDGSIYAAWSAQMLIDLLVIEWTDSKNTPEENIKAGEDLETWAKKIQGLKTWEHAESDVLRTNVPTYLAGIGWKKAEAYQEQGKAGDPEGYRLCAETYSKLYNEFETHDRADTLLFNSARCYDAAYLIGMAIRRRNDLLERHKDSEHYQQTLKELGEGYMAIAYYGKAAERFEQYADSYSKDDFTPSALQNAYLFRLGLGEQEKAQEDMTKYEDLYRKKDPGTAAKIFWSKFDLLDSDAARMQHAQEYLSRYGSKGGVDRQAVAEAAIGQILWRQACSKELLYDSCLTIQRKKASAGEATRTEATKLRNKKKKAEIPTHCGNATQGIVTVYSRDPKKAKDAQNRFASVLKLGAKKPDVPAADVARIENYKNALGMAMVYQADEIYEQYLKVEIPEGLDFTREDWKKDSGVPKWEKEYKAQVQKRAESEKQFKAFYEQKVKLSKDLVERYARVQGSGSPYWVLAAAARTAVLSQNFADQLYRAEIPSSFKTEDQYFAYCDALADQAQASQDTALAAFTYCLQRSTEFQFFNEFSRMCEEELQQRSPDQYPATNELFGTSVYTDSRLDVVGVQVDLEQASTEGAVEEGAGG